MGVDTVVKYFPDVSKTARGRLARDLFEAEEKY